MQITITATDQIHNLDGCECRLWHGVTDEGVEVGVFVHRVFVDERSDLRSFERALLSRTQPLVHEAKSEKS